MSYAIFSIDTGTGLISGVGSSGLGRCEVPPHVPPHKQVEPTNQVTLPGQLRPWAKTEGAHESLANHFGMDPAGAAFVELEQHWALLGWAALDWRGPA